MKIKSLHIAAFGGIKNREINLDDSFNIIYGANENGKTTIMSFIKMMFYGTERSSAQLSKNLRKKYTPWDQSTMAGSIVFENNGRLYKLERIFGSSNSTDKVTLIDLALGTTETVAADIGARLFGLSLGAFERSIFIGQFGFPDTNDLASGELNSKLSNITLTGDEAVSFEAVNKRLETAKYDLISKSGKKGLYDKNLKLCDSLEKELKEALETQDIIEKANAKIREIDLEIKLHEEKVLKLKGKIDSENDFRNSEKLKELLTLKEELDNLNKTLTLTDGKLADEMFVRKVGFCLSKITQIEGKITALQKENTLLQNNLNLALNVGGNTTPEAANQLSQKLSDLENEKQALGEKILFLETQTAQKANPIMLILGLILAALGGVGYFINPIITYVGLALAVIFICIGVAVISKTKANTKQNEAEIVNLKLNETKLISLIATESAKLTAINTALNTNSAMIENQKELLSTNNKEIESLKLEKVNEEQVLFDLFAAFKATQSIEEIITSLQGIKESAQKQKELKQNINYILKDIGNISYDEVKQKLASLPFAEPIDFDAVKTEYDDLIDDLTQLKSTRAAILAEVKALSAGAKNPETIKTELSDLKAKITAQKEYYDSLEIALSVLIDSYTEVRQSYGSQLEKTAGEIFSQLTGGNYRNMSISKSFDIAVEKTDVFGTKELDYLSSGTVDQAYLSLRLALSKLICEETEALPIILDDALAQYDDTRTQTALEFLKEYSTNGQIILFTCHKAITKMAEDLGANKITL